MRAIEAIIRDLDTRDLLELAKEIARKHHVTLEELLGRSHGNPEASARHELWHRLYEHIPSFPKLGQIFGRDHSTILSAVHKHEKSLVPSAPGLASASAEFVACDAGTNGPELRKCAAFSPVDEIRRLAAS